METDKDVIINDIAHGFFFTINTIYYVIFSLQFNNQDFYRLSFVLFYFLVNISKVIDIVYHGVNKINYTYVGNVSMLVKLIANVIMCFTGTELYRKLCIDNENAINTNQIIGISFFSVIYTILSYL